MTTLNPFFHRGPVRDPAYFFGRTAESAYMTELLRAGQSVSLSGPRRFGKTSLLFHLAHPEIAASHSLDPATIRWVYIDGGMLDGLDVEWFYGAVYRALGGEADAVPYARFVESIRTMTTRNERLILALDEFELIAANPRFGPALFNHLRGLAAQYPLQFVTASRLPLGDLTFAHPETLSSPFFNIFAPLSLGLFAQAEAENLLKTLSSEQKPAFSSQTIDFLIGLVGPHPLFLQVAGYRAFNAIDASGNIPLENQPATQSQIANDLEQHLQYYWRNLSPPAQYSLAALPLLAGNGPHTAIEEIEQAGLLQEKDYLGKILEDFVRQQTVSGLIQVAPFLLDSRLGLAAVNNTPLRLTPTEFLALRLFLERAGHVISPEDIEAALWPDEIAPDPERARGVVKKLRSALGSSAKYIVNRRGQGWLLEIGD